jgi:hypothetical protein
VTLQATEKFQAMEKATEKPQATERLQATEKVVEEEGKWAEGKGNGLRRHQPYLQPDKFHYHQDSKYEPTKQFLNRHRNLE